MQATSSSLTPLVFVLSVDCAKDPWTYIQTRFIICNMCTVLQEKWLVLTIEHRLTGFQDFSNSPSYLVCFLEAYYWIDPCGCQDEC